MTDRTCPVCKSGIPAPSGRGRPRKFCSKSCQRWHQRHLADHLPCSIPKCTRPRTARGLCPAHYVQSQYPDRHSTTELVACAACGWKVEKSTSRSKKRRPVCSMRCRYYVTHGHWPRNEIVGPVRFAKATAPPRD